MLSNLPFPFDRRWPLGQAIQLACVFEAAAPKLGNVHPAAAFHNMHFGHFVASAVAIRDVFEDSANHSLGSLVLSGVRETQRTTGCNTNLGTLLLFAPLAKACQSAGQTEFQPRVAQILASLTAGDSRDIYQAIREANPGGMGQRQQDDLAGDAPPDLVEAMRQVAGIDAVARQYTNGFADVFDKYLPWLLEELCRGTEPLDGLCRLQLRLLADEPDGLIVRKLGRAEGVEVQHRAQMILAKRAPHPGPVHQWVEAQQLDAYLRADGHRRNPGTTADLIAATMLVSLL